LLTPSLKRILSSVGANQYHRFVAGETKRNEEGPVATKSVFGWVVSGPIDEQRVSDSNSLFINSNLDQGLRRFWELESLGVESEIESEKQIVDLFINNLLNTMVIGTRYHFRKKNFILLCLTTTLLQGNVF